MKVKKCTIQWMLLREKKMIALSWVNSSVICFSGCYGSDSDEIDKKSSVRHLL